MRKQNPDRVFACTTSINGIQERYPLMNKNASQNSAAIHFCPVCGKYLFQEPFADCPICNWKNDIVQEEHSDWGGCANMMSLNNTREAYKVGKEIQ